MSRAWLLPPAHTHVWVLQAPLPRPQPSAPAPHSLCGDRSSLVLTANTQHSHTHPMGTPPSWYPQKQCGPFTCPTRCPVLGPPTYLLGIHTHTPPHTQFWGDTDTCPCSSWHQALGCDPCTSSHQLAPSHSPLHHPGRLGFHSHHLQSLGLMQFLECPSTIVTDLVCLLSSGLSNLNTSVFYFSHLFFL